MDPIKEYRKKPVVITAWQTDTDLYIKTLEGEMHASPGDWIITGVNGEQYPCKPDIFEKTYEPAEVAENKDTELARLRAERDELRAALEGVVAVRGYAESIERGEDWTGGEPTIGTCRLLGRIKQAANSASAVLSRTEGGDGAGPKT